ncbi:MAG TPA: lipid-A-disaccharide synthase [Steroidobacteraceae bacterium]|nr:lipid-A-disaccharide synthase [Steroidobacteraceae bacterium]
MAESSRAGQPVIGLVAGEVSGDQLGGALIEALRELEPGARFVGLTGEHMRAAGCESLGSCEELAVMGLVEPLRHLPRLLRLRARLRREFLDRRIDVFVGVDAPAFNLGLARWLKSRGIPTAQYVSPQVWAWRAGRIPGIARSVDAVLCLLPFEPRVYAGHPVRALYVGHPLADRIALESGRDAARRALGLAPDDCVVAVLPGSRRGEVTRLGGDFAAACRLLAPRVNGPLQFIAPMASPAVAQIFGAQVRESGAAIRLLDRDADLALAAADVALVASGTATLQAMLHGCPMVVAYRLAALTAFLVRDMGLVKLAHFSLPNLLAGEALVPEFFQQAATGPALAQSLAGILDDPARRQALRARFAALHAGLRQDSARRAAQVVLELAGRAAA